jgi:hypothetical protein
MGGPDEEHAQIMILRAWVEDGGQHRLRVRVIRVRPDRPSEPAISAAATIDGVCALVRAWLEALLNGANGCRHAESGPGGAE